MPNITTYTAFTGELNIPISGIATQQIITDFITYYQEEILIDLLGYSLYKSFIDGLEATSPLQKWIDLRDGKEFSFVVAGETINSKFAGVKKVVEYYIYLKYRNENESFFTGQMQGSANSENAIKSNFLETVIPIYNKMVRYYGLTPYRYDLSFIPVTHFDEYPSAYNFILANKNYYPNWKFTPKQYANIFDI